MERARFIKTLDGRISIPSWMIVIRVLQVIQVPNNDGSTSWHYEYVCEVADRAEGPLE